MSWIEDMTAAVAKAAGMEPEELELDDHSRTEMLDLARIASHDSGDRTNAPLLCYVLGLAVGHGADLDHLAEAIRSETGET